MTGWHPTRAAVLAVAVALALASTVAGCGAGSGGSSSATTPAGAGFISQLGAACRADIAATRSAPKTVAAQSAAQRAFIHSLRALTPTARLTPVYSRYVSAIEQNLAAFERHDVASSKRLESEIKPLLIKLRQAGATAC
jgi:hypothetical protein